MRLHEVTKRGLARPDYRYLGCTGSQESGWDHRTNDPTRTNLWIIDRVVVNNANSDENHGRLYEISWPSAPPT
jgi:hypothetical protein